MNGEQLNHLRFAVDIIIFATTNIHLQYMLIDQEKESRTVGLTMHTSKTKAMTNVFKDPVLLNGEPIEYVKEYELPTDLNKGFNVKRNRYKNRERMEKQLKTKRSNEKYANQDVRQKETVQYIPILSYGCQT